LSITLPKILHRKPILDEIVTVNLVSLPDLPGSSRSESEPARAEPNEPEPVVKPEAAVKIPINPEVAPAPVKQVKPVSLKPLRRKVQKVDPRKLAEEEARRKREEERQKALARAKQEEEKAKQAAEDARAALAEMIRRQGVRSASSGGRRSSGSRQVNSIVEQNYLAALYDRVQQFWVLPEMRHWKKDLETIVVVTIRRDGSISQTVVEKKSRDPFFDQFVMKTLQKAVPMPRFPKLMTQSTIEIGLRFRPGELMSM